MFIFMGLMVLGCADAPKSEPAVVSDTPAVGQPAMSAEQASAMRQPGYCCTELPMQDLVSAYLEMGEALAHENIEGIEVHRLAMSKQLDSIRPTSELAIIREAIATMAGCELLACRAAFATLSEAVIQSVKRTTTGELDIAIAYSRTAKAHWLQSGVEILSPYGDSRESCEWGTRDQVRAADATRGGAPDGEDAPGTQQILERGTGG